VDRSQRKPRGYADGDRGGTRFAATPAAFALGKAANDNRIGLRGWIERAVALELLVGLDALLAWKVAG
jgi:hypothetical protein